MACRHRLGGHALPAHHAHGRSGHPGHDTPHEERLLGPLAVAIASGLFVATVLTLLVLPTMYAAWFKVKRTS